MRFAMLSVLGVVLALPRTASAQGPRFEITIPASLRATALTGRVYVFITTKKDEEPRLGDHGESNAVPFYGVDVDSLQPGTAAVIDGATLGYPVASLKDIPAGDYYVQALVSVYVDFHRADGHVLWMHDDQWEGQQFNISPGNLVSDVQKVHLDPQAGYTIRLELARELPKVAFPPDTKYVKRIKIQSKLLSACWGRPIYLGATVLLPRDYDRESTKRYATVYEQGHFSLNAPLDRKSVV